jgi:hypothetical protein
MQSEESLRVLIRERLASAARCVACHGVGSHPVPVALVSELLRAVRFIRS